MKLNIRPLGLQPIEEWVMEHQGKYICACGCGNHIQIIKSHRSHGIPKVVQGHHKMSMTIKVKGFNEQGLYTVSQAAKMLSLGENTIRRHEGVLFPKAIDTGFKNPKRVFTLDQIEVMRDRWLNAYKNLKELGVFSRQQVSEMVGISRGTLIRYTGSIFPEPIKTLKSRGTKVYTQEQVEQIKNKIKKYIRKRQVK